MDINNSGLNGKTNTGLDRFFENNKNSFRKIGDLLIETGAISEEDLKKALVLQKKTGNRLGEVLISNGFLEERVLLEILGYQTGMSYIDLESQSINPDIPNLIQENMARRHLAFPWRKHDNTLSVAMVDPMNVYAIDDIRLSTGMEIEPMFAGEKDVVKAIDRYYGRQSAEQAVEDLKRQFDLTDANELSEAALADINNAPMVRLVNNLIRQAIQMRASDIHIEPFEASVRIRFRIDGELQEIMTLQKASHSALITRIKIMGRMDIAEKRIPLDGRVETEIDGRMIDMRLSSLPTMFGEKMVIRLLDQGGFLVTKKDLGFTPDNMKRFDTIVSHPNGIILVTGPTGSGKSTTLYSIMLELNKTNRNIITIEDPVEYRLFGINQVQVNNKAGLTFASGLRSILRQDPDIIMVGEIRDAETAQIAVRAAITGHLVISTMHTNDTAATVSRLIDMGIEPYLISSCLVGVLAQRLVRKLCPNCKEKYLAGENDKKLIGARDEEVILYRAKGCNSCSLTGYKGRTAIAEIMPISRSIHNLIDNKRPIEEIREAAKADGIITLQENCTELVRTGVTSIEELLKHKYNLE
ncbi:GspE/PulE family protein [Dehalobacter sp. DCM]|uniref:GspE/PulE family protein n=1 Tax=Dehalobacter sp. DCM TaxID=2907827 RepID=UPI0030813D19|nr:GspE/PulE family protein [Dehalobacter sp. DCM]